MSIIEFGLSKRPKNKTTKKKYTKNPGLFADKMPFEWRQ